MLSRNLLRSWLIGLASGVLLVLLISPGTHWLVSAQIAASGLTVQTPAAQARHAEAVRRRTVAASPNDLQIQMAQAKGTPQEQAAYLRTLIPRFPNSPPLYANLLRHEIGSSTDRNSIYLSRAEDWTLSGQPPPADYQIPPPPDPALLAAFDADAAAGERLDPGNAYFPLMRAVGLFAARRDAAGIAAVLSAGQKPSWQEYVADETNGRLRLADATSGHVSALGRVAIVAAVLFPDYAALRGVARIAIVKAILAEQGGQAERGMAIRRAVMHCGGLMRAQSTVYIGSLVGIAIAAISMDRPGGAPPVGLVPGHNTITPEEMAQRRIQAFCTYARKIGHPEDAAQAQAESAAGRAVRTLWSKAEDHSVLGGAQLAHLSMWWCSDLLTLANAFWLLVLSAIAAGLGRRTATHERRPLLRSVLWGIIVALFVAALVAFDVFSGDTIHFFPVALGVAVGGPALGVFLIRVLRASPDRRAALGRGIGRFALAFLLTGLALFALSLLAAKQTQGVLGYVTTVREFTGMSGSDEGTSGTVPQAQELEVAAISGSLVIPLLMLIALSIAARIRKVPVSAALVQGFRSFGLPLACLLLLIYGILALSTVRREQAMDVGLRQMVEHEGRYYAALAGQPWPQ